MQDHTVGLRDDLAVAREIVLGKSTTPAQVHSFEEWSQALQKRKELSGSGFSIVEEIEDPTNKTRSKHS